jgi:hypothetical protein
VQPRPKAELIDKKIVRKRISELLLIERLHLDQEWLDPENVGGRLPKGLPRRLKKRSPREIKEVEQRLDQLVARGCNRRVLYWCLARFGPREDFFRRGGTKVLPLEDDELGEVKFVFSKLATREKIAPLVEHSTNALEYVRKFRKELLLAADVLMEECPLPEDPWAEGPCDPVEALTQLQSSLKWVRQLASCWATPQETTLMKSKGILYLLVYVAIHSEPVNAGIREPRRKKRGKAHTTEPPKLMPETAKSIAHIAFLCGEMDLVPADLPIKLKRFRKEHPTLHARMVDLLATLDTTANSHPPLNPTRINSLSEAGS